MLTTTRLFAQSGARNEPVAHLYATWDDPQINDDGSSGDPSATGEVSSIRYMNLTSTPKHIIVGGREYTANPGTLDTTINIPAPQRPNMLSTPWQIY